MANSSVTTAQLVLALPFHTPHQTSEGDTGNATFNEKGFDEKIDSLPCVGP